MKDPRTHSGIEQRADFSGIRYAQCWEDADILLAALNIRPGDVCLSIASAGDNTLSLLTRDPSRVVAVDLSPAQLARLELRVAAFRELEHGELLELIGSVESDRRKKLYKRCRSQLGRESLDFWDRRIDWIDRGIGAAGKFENYFRLFRSRILPLVHRRRTVRRLLEGPADREKFYAEEWDNWRWRLLFRLFFSRRVMARHGRDPEFFRYVEETDVAGRILERTRHALTRLDPSVNPYLHWILTGAHGKKALPHSLREENFDLIRNNLDRLEWRLGSLENELDGAGANSVDRFNLSDVFEYLPPGDCDRLFAKLVHSGRSGGRLAYWNMLVPRTGTGHSLELLEDLSRQLLSEDKAFFYSRFVVEKIR